MAGVIDSTWMQPGSIRTRVFEHIQKNPGLHLRKIQRDLGLHLGTLDYHLWWMEKKGHLSIRRLGRYKAYYCNGDQDRRDKDILYFLRQPMPRQILMYVARQERASFRSLSAHVPISASTLSFHLKKLVTQGLLRASPGGRRTWFELLEPERVRRLVLDYEGTLMGTAPVNAPAIEAPGSILQPATAAESVASGA